MILRLLDWCVDWEAHDGYYGTRCRLTLLLLVPHSKVLSVVANLGPLFPVWTVAADGPSFVRVHFQSRWIYRPAALDVLIDKLVGLEAEGEERLLRCLEGHLRRRPGWPTAWDRVPDGSATERSPGEHHRELREVHRAVAGDALAPDPDEYLP